jgi:hypothetical protein
MCEETSNGRLQTCRFLFYVILRRGYRYFAAILVRRALRRDLYRDAVFS